VKQISTSRRIQLAQLLVVLQSWQEIDMKIKEARDSAHKEDIEKRDELTNQISQFMKENGN
jgi:hypothetical protein